MYKLRCLVVQSFSPQYHRATTYSKIEIKTLLSEIKASFDWRNHDDNETVFLPLLPLTLSFCDIYRTKISQCL